MTSEYLRKMTESMRNIERRQAWAERWKALFGTFPPSYKRSETLRTIRRCTLYPSSRGETQDLHRERHSNINIRKFPSHSRQSRYARQTPPEEV